MRQFKPNQKLVDAPSPLKEEKIVSKKPLSFSPELEALVRNVQGSIGAIPVDGLAVTLAVYYLTKDEESKLKNAFIVGSIHYLLHSYAS